MQSSQNIVLHQTPDLLNDYVKLSEAQKNPLQLTIHEDIIAKQKITEDENADVLFSLNVVINSTFIKLSSGNDFKPVTLNINSDYIFAQMSNFALSLYSTKQKDGKLALTIDDIEIGDNISNQERLVIQKLNKFYRDPLFNLKTDFRTVLNRKFLKVRARLYPLSITLRQRFIMFILYFFGVQFNPKMSSEKGLNKSNECSLSQSDNASQGEIKERFKIFQNYQQSAGQSLDKDEQEEEKKKKEELNPSKNIQKTKSNQKDKIQFYIQNLYIDPIKITFNYKSQKLLNIEELTNGNLLEILNLVNIRDLQLNFSKYQKQGAEIKQFAMQFANHFINEIQKNQKLSIVASNYILIFSLQLVYLYLGVGPVRTFVNLGQAVIDIFKNPIQQFQKNGNLLQGLFKGFKNFGETLGKQGAVIGQTVMNIFSRMLQS